MMNIFRTISTRPSGIFVIPSTKIVITNTLRNYRTDFGSGTGFIGRITAVLIIGKAWDLITDSEFWRIHTIIIGLTTIFRRGVLGWRISSEAIVASFKSITTKRTLIATANGMIIPVVNRRIAE